jgi:hypothetical protein
MAIHGQRDSHLRWRQSELYEQPRLLQWLCETNYDDPVGLRKREDFYKPYFMVYNDVIVYPSRSKQGSAEFDIEIDGYPEMVFPPTYFHVAT